MGSFNAIAILASGFYSVPSVLGAKDDRIVTWSDDSPRPIKGDCAFRESGMFCFFRYNGILNAKPCHAKCPCLVEDGKCTFTPGEKSSCPMKLSFAISILVAGDLCISGVMASPEPKKKGKKKEKNKAAEEDRKAYGTCNRKPDDQWCVPIFLGERDAYGTRKCLREALHCSRPERYCHIKWANGQYEKKDCSDRYPVADEKCTISGYDCDYIPGEEFARCT
ncbi:hypothetical protein O9K51_04958 [Purpureocillium lavendulum]|uniref:Uncharacterized protein n=1 Tax=Purpureocillium lavendulum TaxID=1247861 RepID=A0AB34FRE6_9HYPO|nr:hypothetical protein O9K51_04958 [Purpureocillium lavendulum]